METKACVNAAEVEIMANIGVTIESTEETHVEKKSNKENAEEKLMGNIEAVKGFPDDMQNISVVVMTQLELMVNTYRLHPFTELEMNLLHQTCPSGISFNTMNSLYMALVNGTDEGTFKQLQKKTYIDYFYAGNVRGRYVSGKSKPVYIRKTPLARLDVGCIQRPGTIMRFNLKDEAPLRKFAPSGPPLFVRLAEVWDFIYKDKFMYTIKKVVSGKDKQSACLETPSFDVELEMLRNKSAWDQTNDVIIAHSFMSKSIDMIGRWSPQTQTQDFLEVDLLAAFAPGRKHIKAKRKRGKNVKTQQPVAIQTCGT